MTEETKPAEAEVPKVLLLYIGRCILSDGKEGRRFYEVTPEELRESTLAGEPTERVYKRIKTMLGRPGIVYEVPSPSPGTIQSGLAKYHTLWGDQIARAEWQATDFAVGEELALAQRAAKAKTDDALLECLLPIRRAWLKARGVQRGLVLARAIQYITKTGP